MQLDFHYYATYCAAVLAGWSREESAEIAYSAQMVDCCSRLFLQKVKGPAAAATTQLQTELMDARTDILGLQDITRIWSSFHFLPADLKAPLKRGNRLYRSKYRLICGPNGDLAAETAELAKRKGTLQAAGIAMHVLADTWAHRYFAGTPSLVINNTNYFFRELIPEGEGFRERPVVFRHNPAGADDPVQGRYTATPFQIRENSVMNLGHGRAGHLPDYSFMQYCYLPAWNEYREIRKDNPSDYWNAFCQMVYALKFLRGDAGSAASESGAAEAGVGESGAPLSGAAETGVGEPGAAETGAGEPGIDRVGAFRTGVYDTEACGPLKEEIDVILRKRQTDASGDWRALGEKLSGRALEDFDENRYSGDYLAAPADRKKGSFLGRFFDAALAQKAMVTDRIFRSGSLLAGFSLNLEGKNLDVIRQLLELGKLTGGGGSL